MFASLASSATGASAAANTLTFGLRKCPPVQIKDASILIARSPTHPSCSPLWRSYKPVSFLRIGVSFDQALVLELEPQLLLPGEASLSGIVRMKTNWSTTWRPLR